MIETLRRLYRSRALVWVLARRELKARYRGSVLGFLWSLINPLLLLAIYSAVFTLVFVQRAAGLHPYALFLFGGVLAWNFFAASLLDASQTFRANGPLLRKVIVSPEVFPGVSVLAQSFHLALALPVLFAATAVTVAAFSGRIGWTAVQIVPVLLLLAAAALGGALFVSAVSVHFQDLRDLLQSFLTFWFFATPIIYSLDAIPPRLRPWVRANPATSFFVGVHDALFHDRWIGSRDWAAMIAAAAASVALGAWTFSRLRESIAEEA
jgi:ABC-type polysaccharide/polyol phosphate export permease